jgi:hypothetical protein
MKTSFKLLAMAAASSMLLASPVLHAESTYGYGTGQVSATARLEVRVTVPGMIMLRIGAPGGRINTAFLDVGPTGIPGGVSTLSTGNNQETGWDGTAPPLGVTTTGATFPAWAWTNRGPFATLLGAVTTPFPAGSGLTAGNVLVSSGGAGGLDHPGANTGAFTATRFRPNAVASSTWTYSLSPAGAAAVTAGSHTQVLTYTAVSM